MLNETCLQGHLMEIPEMVSYEALTEMFDIPNISDDSFSLQESGHINLQTEDDDINSLWGFLNVLTPVDWSVNIQGSVEKGPSNSRKTAYSEGIHMNMIMDTLSRFPNGELHIKNAILLCEILEDPEIGEDVQKTLATYARYCFIPIVNAFELPELSQRLEDNAFRILEEEQYDEAFKLWFKKYGIEYTDEYKQSFVELIKTNIVANTDFKNEEDFLITVRKKSLYAFYLKYQWKQKVDDGYAATVILKEGANYKKVVSREFTFGRKIGAVLEEAVIIDGFVSQPEMDIWMMESIENSIDKPHKINPDFRVLQTIISYSGSKLPFKRFELRVVPEGLHETNIASRLLYKRESLSHKRNISKDGVLLLGQLTRLLLRNALFKGQYDNGMGEVISKLQSSRGFPICVDDGHTTILTNQIPTPSVWQYLEGISKKINTQTTHLIEGFSIKRNVITDGLVRTDEYFIQWSAQGSVVYMIVDEEKVLINDFTIKPYDTIEGMYSALQEGILSYHPLLTLNKLFRVLSSENSHNYEELLASLQLGHRLPEIIYYSAGDEGDLRRNMLNSWRASLDAYRIALKHIPLSKRGGISKIYASYEKRIGRVIKIVDMLKFSEDNNLSTAKYTQLRKLLLEISDEDEQYYLWGIIESNQEYKRVIGRALDYKEFFQYQKVRGKVKFTSNTDRRRAWVRTAMQLQEQGFNYLFNMMRTQILKEVLVHDIHVWRDMLELGVNESGVPIVEDIFYITEGVAPKDVNVSLKKVLKLYDKYFKAEPIRFENAVRTWLSGIAGSLQGMSLNKEDSFRILLGAELKKAIQAKQKFIDLFKVLLNMDFKNKSHVHKDTNLNVLLGNSPNSFDEVLESLDFSDEYISLILLLRNYPGLFIKILESQNLVGSSDLSPSNIDEKAHLYYRVICLYELASFKHPKKVAFKKAKGRLVTALKLLSTGDTLGKSVINEMDRLFEADGWVMPFGFLKKRT